MASLIEFILFWFIIVIVVEPDQDVAHDEIEEVDGLVEDIAEEIRDLHNLVILTKA